MGLSKREFAVLLALHDGKVASQRDVAAHADVSLGTVNTIMKKLHDEGLAEGFALTEAGAQALEPYKVDNAIIMAAGLSSRFVPLSYERPKGVLCVRGEVLIERQIRQLQEAGITDITVVVGYMKEAFFYLEDAFGVKIRVNEQYASRNNNSTLMLVREQLGNTYNLLVGRLFYGERVPPVRVRGLLCSVVFPGRNGRILPEDGARWSHRERERGRSRRVGHAGPRVFRPRIFREVPHHFGSGIQQA